MKKCSKQIIKENNYQTEPGKEQSYEMRFVLASQKSLKSSLFALAQLVEPLEQIDYDSANRLEMIFA